MDKYQFCSWIIHLLLHKVFNLIQSEVFRKMYIRQSKNDSKDSFIIAQIMRFGQYSETKLAEESIIALR